MTHEYTRPDTMLGYLTDQLTTGIDFSLDQGVVADAAFRCECPDSVLFSRQSALNKAVKRSD